MTASRPYRICLVCLGNICRSPMATTVLRHKLDKAGLTGVRVESAGTGGWHAGEPADPRAVGALRERGYDGSSHQARRFDPDWFARCDLVLAMDRNNLTELHRMAPERTDQAKIRLFREYDRRAISSGQLDVPDPYYGGPDGFSHVLDQLEHAADGLVEALQREFEC